MKSIIFGLLTIIILVGVPVFASNATNNLAVKAVSVDKNEAKTAIDALRQMKQKGLDLLFQTYKKDIEKFAQTGERSRSWLRISKAIDGVSMQKDAYSSQLFWHTDITKAKENARENGKPILSLRLLGNLNEEYSCANSRFFRSILYSNTKIAKHLRENYVLHWKSVRPAPKITIDFGDGRKLVRTITGNSIHYVLDKNGQILDALPGLYNPKDFLNYLVNVSYAERNPRKTANYWNRYREIRRNRLLSKWQSDIKKIGLKNPRKSDIELPAPETVSVRNENDKKPAALKAVRLAVTKAVVEMPTVLSIAYDVESMKKKTTFEEWKELSKLFGKAEIDEASRTFIARKMSLESAVNKDEMSRLISTLEKYVSIDTVQNEYVFHTEIYKWLNEGLGTDVETFNERVYSELFLTPRSDKWLGLYSPDIYSAIENNGVLK